MTMLELVVCANDSTTPVVLLHEGDYTEVVAGGCRMQEINRSKGTFQGYSDCCPLPACLQELSNL